MTQPVEPGSWITSRLHSFGQDVGSVIPDGFAYARVLHPLYRTDDQGRETPVRWHEVAAANGRSVQSEMKLLGMGCDPTRFSPTGAELWAEQAYRGALPNEVAERLAGILTEYTRTPESCWFAVWEGFGDLQLPSDAGVRFSIPGRDFLLFRRRVGQISRSFSDRRRFRSPSIWWPDDKAWCVATEIDFRWTYVGGPAPCIERILLDPQLEALPTKPTEGNIMEK